MIIYNLFARYAITLTQKTKSKIDQLRRFEIDFFINVIKYTRREKSQQKILTKVKITSTIKLCFLKWVNGH